MQLRESALGNCPEFYLYLACVTISASASMLCCWDVLKDTRLSLYSVLLWPAPERRTYYITNTYSLWPCFSWKPGTRQRCCNSCEPHSFSGFISLPIDFPKRGPGMLSGNLNLKLRSFSSLGHLLIQQWQYCSSLTWLGLYLLLKK